jgi:hypothetical protein
MHDRQRGPADMKRQRTDRRGDPDRGYAAESSRRLLLALKT